MKAKKGQKRQKRQDPEDEDETLGTCPAITNCPDCGTDHLAQNISDLSKSSYIGQPHLFEPKKLYVDCTLQRRAFQQRSLKLTKDRIEGRQLRVCRSNIFF
ncbi:MAG: hypothetical protein P4L49_19505 [Desulfosporosinus sp.]|nr:hypothetical protein [Desulfosporosinus sp.]